MGLGRRYATDQPNLDGRYDFMCPVAETAAMAARLLSVGAQQTAMRRPRPVAAGRSRPFRIRNQVGGTLPQAATTLRVPGKRRHQNSRFDASWMGWPKMPCSESHLVRCLIARKAPFFEDVGADEGYG
jgi:hypothetical protein